MGKLLARLESEHELVIVDTPPVGVVADALPLVPRVDGVVVVLGAGKTTRDHAAATRAQLEAVGAPLLGCVLNFYSSRDIGGSGSYYYGYEVKADRDTVQSSSLRERLESSREV